MRSAQPTHHQVTRIALVPFLVLLVGGCEVGGRGQAPPPDGGVGSGSGGAGGGNQGGTGGSPAGGTTGSGGTTAGGTGGTNPMLPEPTANPNFQVRPEFAGPCTKAAGLVDVNLGNRPEDFVRAAFCQINGSEPAPDLVTRWANQLRTVESVRRIDVVRTLCNDAARVCRFSYSDPWQGDIPLLPTCTRKGTRDLGAVFMFFSDCPTGVNCGMDWANTHAHGMTAVHPLFAFGAGAANFYNGKNSGYWYRQLLDARWAGLQFFLLNTYGPDMNLLPNLQQALTQAGPGVKIGLFDDPWAWGQPSSPAAFRTLPNLSDTEGAAQAIYQGKWKPFFTRIDKMFWYTVQGKPLIYFYNSGNLKPANTSAAVVARMKQLFTADFGVAPFVAVDHAYFDDPNMPNVADSQFTWDTLRSGNKSRAVMGGVTLDHFMVKWDTVGRDKPGTIASPGDRIIKGTSLLSDRLGSSQDATIATIATWNDLGEGTGIERNYDYYFGGMWQPPTAFMSLTRAAQCSD